MRTRPDAMPEYPEPIAFGTRSGNCRRCSTTNPFHDANRSCFLSSSSKRSTKELTMLAVLSRLWSKTFHTVEIKSLALLSDVLNPRAAARTAGTALGALAARASSLDMKRAWRCRTAGSAALSEGGVEERLAPGVLRADSCCGGWFTVRAPPKAALRRSPLPVPLARAGVLELVEAAPCWPPPLLPGVRPTSSNVNSACTRLASFRSRALISPPCSSTICALRSSAELKTTNFLAWHSFWGQG